MHIQFPLVLLIISIVLFIAALTQDAYYIEADDPRSWATSWILLFAGWMGLFAGVFAWLANPLLILGWVFSALGSHRAGLLTAVGALLLALSFLLHTTIISSEAPTYSRITGYGTGYWLWVASAAVLVAANLVAFVTGTTRPAV